MKKIILAIFCVGIIICSIDAVQAQNMKSDLSETLRGVVTANFQAYEKEDIDKVMKTVHSASPGFQATKEFSSKIFPAFEIKYEMMSFKFIATEGDYALGRVKQKTSKVSGPEFSDNIIDAIVIFKQENGVWKLWSQATLTVEYI